MNKEFQYNELIFDSFNKILKTKVSNESAIKIINKGKSILDVMHTVPRIDKKFLMVGKIQSGKTLGFISIIANAIREGTKLFTVITGLDNELDSQTLKRIKDYLESEENSNFLKFYSCNEIFNNKDKINEIIKNIQCDKIVIITTLKTAVHKVTDKLTSNKILKNENMLIIDDEGDLASLTHTEKKDSKTYEKIKELFEQTNSTYISVTATPQAHIMSEKTKVLRPNRVFCIEPGEGYHGIDIFTKDDRYYSIIEKTDVMKDFIITDIFADAILYYLIVASKLLMDGDFNHRSHSNMLIHTDIKTDTHKKYKQKIEELVDHYTKCLSVDVNSIEFKDLNIKINKIIQDNKLDIIVNNEFISYLNHSMKNLVVSQINQNEKPEINNNFCNIFIGSQLVGRGLTLDNLLVTFFTNRAKNNMAIDTLLQRARWFGYRKDILKYMKIFTTKQIIDDFREIALHENKTWFDLKDAESNNVPFENLKSQIEIGSFQKLIATNKVPTKRIHMQKYYCNKNIKDIINFKSGTTRLIKNILESNEYFTASNYQNSKYTFKTILFDNFEKLFNMIGIDYFIDVLQVDETHLSEIVKIANTEKIRIRAVLLDSKEEIDLKERNDSENSNNLIPRKRECSLIDDEYLVENIFQGSNKKNVLNSSEYVGDLYWYDLDNCKNDILLQIHYVNPRNNKINISNGDNLFIFCLWIPKQISTESKILFSSK